MVRREIKDGSPSDKSAPHTTRDEWWVERRIAPCLMTSRALKGNALHTSSAMPTRPWQCHSFRDSEWRAIARALIAAVPRPLHPLTPLDASKRRPYQRRRRFPTIKTKPGPRTQWCAAMGQWPGGATSLQPTSQLIVAPSTRRCGARLLRARTNLGDLRPHRNSANQRVCSRDYGVRTGQGPSESGLTAT